MPLGMANIHPFLRSCYESPSRNTCTIIPEVTFYLSPRLTPAMQGRTGSPIGVIESATTKCNVGFPKSTLTANPGPLQSAK